MLGTGTSPVGAAERLCASAAERATPIWPDALLGSVFAAKVGPAPSFATRAVGGARSGSCAHQLDRTQGKAAATAGSDRIVAAKLSASASGSIPTERWPSFSGNTNSAKCP